MPTALAQERPAAVAAASPEVTSPTRPAPTWYGPQPTRSGVQRAQLAVTLLIVGLPLAGVVVVAASFLGGSATLVNLSLLTIGYVITGLGITAGFHRLFTHRSFTANRGLRISLAVAGSLAFEGGVISWVATHRRHHAFSDRSGDPHSPHRYGGGLWGQLRGVGHAHLGWLFGTDTTSVSQYAPDLQNDPTMRWIDRAFPLFCLVSLGLPMLAGYLLTGTLHGAVTGLVWGGLVRIFVLHHVTWSVNSLCHLTGSRPFKTRRADRATNLWPLALVSFGDSWHNLHHADPTSARHGVDRGQIDIAAGFIRLCERLGWASNVCWPDAARIDARRRA
jgi:stearoyl-CoA desaturase (Delta-9 desaturase)